MARRYRYAFAKQKEAQKGKLSVGCAIASFLLFVAACVFSFFLGKKAGFVVGAFCVAGALIAVYGFLMGLSSFQEQDRKHSTSMIGSVAGGLMAVGWIALFLLGV